jgi:hypothetical protein
VSLTGRAFRSCISDRRFFAQWLLYPRSRATIVEEGIGDLVADALAGDLPLELRKGQQHIEGQPPIELVVLNCWVTDTNDTPCVSKISTSRTKSASDPKPRSWLPKDGFRKKAAENFDEAT